MSIDSMTVLKGVCLAAGAAMHVAPIPAMRKIREAGSTLNYHIAPYASTLLNHLVNLWYALIRQDGPLIIHRICGITAQATYLSTYMTYCPVHKTPDNKRWLTWVAGILVGIFVWLHVLLPLFSLNYLYNPHIAFFGAVTGIGLAAAPLATVSEVLRTKDASSLPVHLCAMVTLQCFSWMIYGYLRDDLSTFSNNLVGVILGSIQLTLIWLYGNGPAGKLSAVKSSGSAIDDVGVADGGSSSAVGGASRTVTSPRTGVALAASSGAGGSTVSRRGSGASAHGDDTLHAGDVESASSHSLGHIDQAVAETHVADRAPLMGRTSGHSAERKLH